MELSDLRILKAVVEEGGILRAARKLHRVQSNITTRIKQLEASLGAQLFFRDGGRLVLSPKGEALLEYAEQMLRLAEEARTTVSAQCPSGVLRLGALESTSASRLPDLLSGFHSAFPDVRVELRTGTNDALTAAVAARQLDAAFVVDKPCGKVLASMPAFEETLVLISSLHHRPVSKPRDVHGDSIIAFPTGCAYRRVLERWLGRRAISTMRVLEMSSYHAAVACVASGTGIALTPASVLEVVRTAEVRRHPMPEVMAHVETQLVWRTGEASPSVTAMRELLRSSSYSAVDTTAPLTVHSDEGCASRAISVSESRKN